MSTCRFNSAKFSCQRAEIAPDRRLGVDRLASHELLRWNRAKIVGDGGTGARCTGSPLLTSEASRVESA